MKPSRDLGLGLPAAALTAVLLCAPATALAAKDVPAGDLSPRLAELALPGVRAASPRARARRLDLPARGPGSLLRDGGRVLVEVRFGDGAPAPAAAVRSSGAPVLAVGGDGGTVTAAPRPDQLRRLARAPGAQAVTEVLTPLVHATGGAGPAAAGPAPCFGAATSEGDRQLGAARARAEFGVDGAGVEVGVLSDSFDTDPAAVTDADDDVARGDLPGPGNPCGREDRVAVLEDPHGGSDEGRAMAQIVHDLAPGADISFATAFTGMSGFAANVEALADAGASVIVDDVSYFEEPFFQEGPVGVAVSKASAGGAAYFSSAGNDNLRSGGRDIASWEAPAFRDAGSCPAMTPPYATHCMDFDPGAGVDPTFGITVSPGATLSLDLQWAQPWEGVSTDLDAYLLGAAGEELAASEDFNVATTQRPFEFLSWTNEGASARTVRLAIDRCGPGCDSEDGGDDGTPRLKLAMLQNGAGVSATEYPESSGGDVVGPTVFGHNGAAGAQSLGAIRYDATAAPEAFSSRGPVTHYFGPVGGSGPAAPLGEALRLAKPDLVATDGGASGFFGACLGDVWRFFGTSAAAPHAAAVAALQREAAPGASGVEVREAQTAAADPVGSQPEGAVGAGLLDAVGAVEALGVSPAAPGAEPAAAPEPAPCFPPAPGEDAPEEEAEPAPPEEGDSGSDSPEPEEEGGSTDAEGSPEPSSGGSAEPAAADRTRPRAFFRRHPRRLVRTRFRRARALFAFGASERPVHFVCRVDRRRPRLCRFRVAPLFGRGLHVLRVWAFDPARNLSRRPAVFRFRVVRLRRR